MANEATLYIETEPPIPMTIHKDLAVEKGTLLVMIDPFSVSKHASAGQAIAGIAAEEHIASVGKTEIAVYRRGFFKITVSSSILAGNSWLASATANKIQGANATDQHYGGTAFETAANDETLFVELAPFNISQ